MLTNRVKVFILLVNTIFIFWGCKDDPVQQNETNDPVTPNPPVLLQPANQSNVNTFFVNFDWEDYTGSNAYRVMISSDANFAINVILDTVVSVSSAILTRIILNTNNNYYWRVKAYGSDTSSWSQTWRFIIILEPPGPPGLVSPLNNSINIPFLPVFEWNSVPMATAYRLQLSGNNNFNIILLDTNRIPLTHLNAPLFIINTNSLYYWRVLASNSNGVSNGPWSDTWNFTTVSGPHPNSISGRVTFADNNFASNGEYVVSVHTLWPPTGTMAQLDTLNIQNIGGVYVGDYTVSRLTNSNYYISCSFKSNLGGNYTLGIYGCDTNRIQYSNCPLDPKFVTLTNNNGLTDKNILSWADTANSVIGN